MSFGKLESHLAKSASQEFGWFEDFETTHNLYASDYEDSKGEEEPVRRALSLPPPATDPPVYILESSIDSQHLWYTTAGTRPRQPVEERKYFEQLWQKNFAESNVIMPVETQSYDGGPKENLMNLKNEFKEEVLYRGKGPFSNAVSKSFMNHCLSCMTVQVLYMLF
jgi:hypothetical protein